MDKEYFIQKKKEIEEFRQKMRDEGKQFFGEISKEIFDAHPTLAEFSWTQYTPYFNDGDPCTFSAHHESPSMVVDGEDNEDDDGWYSDKDESPRANIWRSVSNSLKQFSDEDMEMLFGDHCRVTVKRGGDVEVEEYSHD